MRQTGKLLPRCTSTESTSAANSFPPGREVDFPFQVVEHARLTKIEGAFRPPRLNRFLWVLVPLPLCLKAEPDRQLQFPRRDGCRRVAESAEVRIEEVLVHATASEVPYVQRRAIVAEVQARKWIDAACGTIEVGVRRAIRRKRRQIDDARQRIVTVVQDEPRMIEYVEGIELELEPHAFASRNRESFDRRKVKLIDRQALPRVAYKVAVDELEVHRITRVTVDRAR